MTKEEALFRLTNTIAKFVAYTSKRLPDDVREKLKELGAQEDTPLAIDRKSVV